MGPTRPENKSWKSLSERKSHQKNTSVHHIVRIRLKNTRKLQRTTLPTVSSWYLDASRRVRGSAGSRPSGPRRHSRTSRWSWTRSRTKNIQKSGFEAVSFPASLAAPRNPGVRALPEYHTRHVRCNYRHRRGRHCTLGCCSSCYSTASSGSRQPRPGRRGTACWSRWVSRARPGWLQRDWWGRRKTGRSRGSRSAWAAARWGCSKRWSWKREWGWRGRDGVGAELRWMRTRLAAAAAKIHENILE